VVVVIKPSCSAKSPASVSCIHPSLTVTSNNQQIKQTLMITDSEGCIPALVYSPQYGVLCLHYLFHGVIEQKCGIS